jgi:hypothetical protein
MTGARTVGQGPLMIVDDFLSLLSRHDQERFVAIGAAAMSPIPA